MNGKMVRTRGRDCRIVTRGQLRRGVSTSIHSELAIDLGSIPYFGILLPSDPGSPYISSHSLTPSSSPSSSIPSSSGHGELQYASLTMLTIVLLLLQSTTSTLRRSSVTLLVRSSSDFLVKCKSS